MSLPYVFIRFYVPRLIFTYHAENIHRVYIHAKIQTGRRTDGRTDELLPVMGTS